MFAAYLGACARALWKYLFLLGQYESPSGQQRKQQPRADEPTSHYRVEQLTGAHLRPRVAWARIGVPAERHTNDNSRYTLRRS